MKGTWSPLFLYLKKLFFWGYLVKVKMNQAKVRYLVEEALAENETLFLIDLSISVNNKINVVVDGDEGVPLSECIRISRNVEHNLDREAEDFSLEVSTPDISKPIKLKRQYIKNIQRILKATTIADEEIEGILTDVTD